jgi:hypothetical protein
MENTTVITDLNRTISVRGRMLRIWHTDDKATTVGAYLYANEARQIADAIDPDRAATTLVRDDYTLDEARALVARLEETARRETAALLAARAERVNGIEALRRAMVSDIDDYNTYRSTATRAYDRGVRAPSTPTTEEN